MASEAISFTLSLKDAASAALAATATEASNTDAAVEQVVQALAAAEAAEKQYAQTLGVTVQQLRAAQAAVNDVAQAQTKAAQATDSAAKRAAEGGRGFDVLAPAARSAAGAAAEVAKSSGKMGQVFQGLVPQINDVVTSLAMGAPPMTVLAQQGGQIVQVFTQAGVSLSGLGAIIGPVAIAVAGLAATWAVLNAELEKMDERNKAAAKSAQELSDAVNASRKSTADLNTEYMLATGQTTPQAAKMAKQLADEAAREASVRTVLTGQIEEHRRALDALNKASAGASGTTGAKERASQKAALEAALATKEAALAGNAATHEMNVLKIEAIKLSQDEKDKANAASKQRVSGAKQEKAAVQGVSSAYMEWYAEQRIAYNEALAAQKEFVAGLDKTKGALDASMAQLIPLATEASTAFADAISPRSLLKGAGGAAIKAAFGGTVGEIFTQVGAFADRKNSPLDQATDATKAFLKGMANIGPELGQFFTDGLLFAVKKLPNAVVGLVEGIINALPEIQAALVALIPTLVQETIKALARLAGDFWRAIFTSDGRKQIVDAIKEAFRAALGLEDRDKGGLFSQVGAAFRGDDPAETEKRNRKQEKDKAKRRYAA